MGHKIKRIVVWNNGVEQQIRPKNYLKQGIRVSTKVLIDSSHRNGMLYLWNEDKTIGVGMGHSTYQNRGIYVSLPDGTMPVAYNYSSLNGWYDFIIEVNRTTGVITCTVEQGGSTVWTTTGSYSGFSGKRVVGLTGGYNYNDRNFSAKGYKVEDLLGNVYANYDFTGGLPAGTNVYADGAVTNTGWNITDDIITLSTNPYGRMRLADRIF